MHRPTALGIALIVVGVLIGGFTLVRTVTGVGDRVDRLARVPAPGSETIRLDAGKQVIYAEFEGTVSKNHDRLRVTIGVDGPSGALTVEGYSGESVYNLSGRHGRAIATVRVPESGDYRLTVGASETGPAPAGIAIGPSVMSATAFVLPLIGAILALVGGLVGGILTIVFSRRRRARQRRDGVA